MIACQVNNDKNFAFLEFRSTEEATKVNQWNVSIVRVKGFISFVALIVVSLYNFS